MRYCATCHEPITDHISLDLEEVAAPVRKAALSAARHPSEARSILRSLTRACPLVRVKAMQEDGTIVSKTMSPRLAKALGLIVSRPAGPPGGSSRFRGS